MTDRIRVGKLSVRLVQCSPQQARALAEALGREVLQALAESAAGRSGARSIGELSLGKVTLQEHEGAGAVRRQIAGRVASALQKKSG